MLQKWLPDTMVAFAAHTGAGGFGFDYTYFEQVWEHSSAEGRCEPHAVISPAIIRSSNGFDYTYCEQNADGKAGPIPTTPASQYAQWTGWRKILSSLRTAKGGKACGGGPFGAGASSCVVDNRQQNHAWGPWMWTQGGTYAEPLMSDEQPGSWMFYEADLHTDRLSANEERVVAWNYRNLEFCPAEVLPGFAMHQTDRDPTVLQHDQR